MRVAIILFWYSLIFSNVLIAQKQSNEHYLVEFDKFTPPIKDLVASFENYKAESFLASDISGKEHYLGDYKGRKVLLWFWSTQDKNALDQIAPMSLLQERNPEIKLIAFVKETKTQVADFVRKNPVSFSVIPNGEVFGQMAYGADLGSPRMFLLDEYGVIKVVLPAQSFTDNTRLLISLESILNGY